jgi:hypothetical protein
MVKKGRIREVAALQRVAHRFSTVFSTPFDQNKTTPKTAKNQIICSIVDSQK